MNAIPAPRAATAAEDADRRTLAFFADLSQALALSLDLQQTLEQAITRIVDYMQAEAASLFLLDPVTDVLECRICVGPVDITGLKLAKGQGVIGSVVANNQVQIVRDAQADVRFNSNVDAVTGFVTRSIVCAPLATALGPIGALQVLNRRDGGLFEQADVELLRLLAAPTSLAINNARMARDLIEQQRIKRELELARRLQKSLFPKRRKGGFPLIGINLPAHEISGDFYDYFDLPDERIAFVLGDVSGKGVNAAFLMIRAASLLRWAGKDGLSPADWLARANDELCETVSDGMFVCALVGVYDRRTRDVVFAGAGFPPALLVAHGEFREFLAGGPPLGIVAGSTFEETRLALGDGSLYLFSDGVTDVRDEQRRPIGSEGVRALVARHAGAAPEARLRALVGELKRLKLVDDTTLMLLEEPRTGHTTQVLLKLAFPAVAQELRGLRASLRAALDGQGVTAEMRDKLVLAVDEACGNIIRHAYAGCCTGDIVFRLLREDDVLQFELYDKAPPVDASRIKPRDLDDCRPGGLGINFIDALMDEWRIEALPGGRGNCLRMRKRVGTAIGELE